MRTTGLILVQTGLYILVGIAFGLYAFIRTNAYKQRTGKSPWHIHPLVWGGVSVFLTFLVTLASIAVVAIFGVVMSIVAVSPRLQPSRGRTATEVSRYPATQSRPAQPGPLSPKTPSGTPAGSTVRLTAWLSDPTGRNELRYFDGSSWTEHVSNSGVISTDEI